MDGIVDKMAAPDRAMTMEDLPESIINTFMDDSGKYNLVTIFPKEDVFKDLESMERLNHVLFEVSPRITGMTQITTAWLEEATSSTIKAGLYILAAVIIFLLISFRSIRYTLLAAAPLIIGMGIDFGIHLAHRFQVEQDINAVYRYTGKAVFLSAFTTMIGFGSLGLIGKFPSLFCFSHQVCQGFRIEEAEMGNTLYMRLKGDSEPEDGLHFHFEASYTGSTGNQIESFAVDHLWGAAAIGPLDLQFGKMPIAWGTGYVFNPTARTSSSAFMDTISEETPGVRKFSLS